MSCLFRKLSFAAFLLVHVGGASLSYAISETGPSQGKVDCGVTQSDPVLESQCTGDAIYRIHFFLTSRFEKENGEFFGLPLTPNPDRNSETDAHNDICVNVAECSSKFTSAMTLALQQLQSKDKSPMCTGYEEVLHSIWTMISKFELEHYTYRNNANRSKMARYQLLDLYFDLQQLTFQLVRNFDRTYDSDSSNPDATPICSRNNRVGAIRNLSAAVRNFGELLSYRFNVHLYNERVRTYGKGRIPKRFDFIKEHLEGEIEAFSEQYGYSRTVKRRAISLIKDTGYLLPFFVLPVMLPAAIVATPLAAYGIGLSSFQGYSIAMSMIE